MIFLSVNIMTCADLREDLSCPHQLDQVESESSFICKGNRRQIAKAAVRTMMTILLSPLFNNDLYPLSTGKAPTLQTFTAKRAIEALDEGIFLGLLGVVM